MFDKLSNNAARWFFAGILIGAVCAGSLRGDALRAGAGKPSGFDLPERVAGGAHGSFCQILGQGSYFFGRQVTSPLRTYEEFVTWCRRYGGRVRWAE